MLKTKNNLAVYLIYLLAVLPSQQGKTAQLPILSQICIMNVLRNGLDLKTSAFGNFSPTIIHLKKSYYGRAAIDYADSYNRLLKLTHKYDLTKNEIKNLGDLNEYLKSINLYNSSQKEIAEKTKTLLGEFGISAKITEEPFQDPDFGNVKNYIIELIPPPDRAFPNDHWLKKLAFGLNEKNHKLVFKTQNYVEGASYNGSDNVVSADFGSLFGSSPSLTLRHELTHFAVRQKLLEESGGKIVQKPIFRRSIAITSKKKSLFEYHPSLKATDYAQIGYHVDEIDARMTELTLVEWLLQKKQTLTSSEYYFLNQTLTDAQSFVEETKTLFQITLAQQDLINKNIVKKKNSEKLIKDYVIVLANDFRIEISSKQFSKNGQLTNDSIKSALKDELSLLEKQEIEINRLKTELIKLKPKEMTGN